MQQSKLKIKSRITFYRRRIGFAQRRVAMLMGHRDATTLSAFESGRAIPSLAAALRLGIILRIPVEFLYPELYESMRSQIRQQEEGMDHMKTRSTSDYSLTSKR